jgi:hypothetical protein
LGFEIPDEPLRFEESFVFRSLSRGGIKLSIQVSKVREEVFGGFIAQDPCQGWIHRHDFPLRGSLKYPFNGIFKNGTIHFLGPHAKTSLEFMMK